MTGLAKLFESLDEVLYRFALILCLLPKTFVRIFTRPTRYALTVWQQYDEDVGGRFRDGVAPGVLLGAVAVMSGLSQPLYAWIKQTPSGTNPGDAFLGLNPFFGTASSPEVQVLLRLLQMLGSVLGTTIVVQTWIPHADGWLSRRVFAIQVAYNASLELFSVVLLPLIAFKIRFGLWDWLIAVWFLLSLGGPVWFSVAQFWLLRCLGHTSFRLAAALSLLSQIVGFLFGLIAAAIITPKDVWQWIRAMF